MNNNSEIISSVSLQNALIHNVNIKQLILYTPSDKKNYSVYALFEQ
jgi:hypothetical protein